MWCDFVELVLVCKLSNVLESGYYEVYECLIFYRLSLILDISFEEFFGMFWGDGLE